MAVRVCIWVAHGDVDIVIIMLQRKFEAERVEIRWLLLINSNNLAGSLRKLTSLPWTIPKLLAIYLAQRLIVLIVGNIVA